MSPRAEADGSALRATSAHRTLRSCVKLAERADEAIQSCRMRALHGLVRSMQFGELSSTNCACRTPGHS